MSISLLIFKDEYFYSYQWAPPTYSAPIFFWLFWSKINNLNSKANIWFNYDVHRATWLFLNGEFRNTKNLLRSYLLKNEKCCIYFFFFSITRGYSVFHILFVIFTTMFHCISFHLNLQFWSLYFNYNFSVLNGYPLDKILGFKHIHIKFFKSKIFFFLLLIITLINNFAY